MPKCTDETVEFGRVGRRVVEAAFDGGDIVSDGGVLLLRRVDERLGLTRAAAHALGDDRRGASVQHSVHSLLAQRIYGLCLGWSDVCDHNVLRNDLVMQTAAGRDEPLGSAPTPPGDGCQARACRCASRSADAAVRCQPCRSTQGTGA